MDLIAIYDHLIQVTNDIFGLDPIRNSPRNLHPTLTAPSMSIGYSTSNPSAIEGIGSPLASVTFDFGYFGTDEDDLLKKVELVDEYIGTITIPSELTDMRRIENADGINVLEYAFIFSLEIER